MPPPLTSVLLSRLQGLDDLLVTDFAACVHEAFMLPVRFEFLPLGPRSDRQKGGVI